MTYTPASNFFGSDSFTYKVTDAASGDSNTATASLTVTTQNDLPTAGQRQHVGRHRDAEGHHARPAATSSRAT